MVLINLGCFDSSVLATICIRPLKVFLPELFSVDTVHDMF
jgi:hypothetical protein